MAPLEADIATRKRLNEEDLDDFIVLAVN